MSFSEQITVCQKKNRVFSANGEGCCIRIVFGSITANMPDSNRENGQFQVSQDVTEAQEDHTSQQSCIQHPNTDPNFDKSHETISFDRIYNEIGEFGLYLKITGVVMGFWFAYGTFPAVNFLFGAAIPDHR